MSGKEWSVEEFSELPPASGGFGYRGQGERIDEPEGLEQHDAFVDLDVEGCEFTGSCDFFRGMLPHLPAMVDVYRRKYCEGDRNGCARFHFMQIFGTPELPMDLFPADTERVRQLAEEANKPYPPE
jgi:hypothetical protein